MFVTDFDQALRALELFHRPGEIIEIRYRYLKKDGSARATGKQFLEAEQAANYAMEVSQRENVIAVWHNLNRIKSGTKIEKLVKDEHIDRYNWLLIDVEAVRPDDTNATDAELEAARGEVAKIEISLEAAGFGKPVVIMSGNGWHLRYRIDEPANGDLIPRVLYGVAKLVDRQNATVDRRVGNPGRVAKLPGTAARKTEHTDERPHRMARIEDAPDEIVVTPTAALEKLAAPVSELQSQESQQRSAADPFDTAMAPAVFDVATWLTANDCKFHTKTKADGTTVYEIPCPWKPNARTGGGACIMQDAEARLPRPATTTPA